MTMPLVTIGIPVHNNAKYIQEALASALAQEYEPLEIIVVDDQSTDDSFEIAEGFKIHVYGSL